MSGCLVQDTGLSLTGLYPQKSSFSFSFFSFDEWVPGSGHWVAHVWPLFSKVFYIVSFVFQWRTIGCLVQDWIAPDWPLFSNVLFFFFLFSF
jgi:hypothetical protein